MTPRRSRPLTLHAATPADLDRIMALEADGFAPGHREARAVYARRIAVFPQGALLTGPDDAVVGCLFAELWRPDVRLDATAFALGHDIAARHDPVAGTTLYVSSMTIAPACRGRGLGAQLLDAAMTRIAATSPRVDAVLLLVNERWTAAQAIYGAAGFIPVTRLPGFFTPEGTAREDGLVMRRTFATG